MAAIVSRVKDPGLSSIVSERVASSGFLRKRAPSISMAATKPLRSFPLDNSEDTSRWDYGRILFVAATALFSSRVSLKPSVTVDVVGFAATCAGGYPIFTRGLRSLLQRQLTAELCLTFAIGASLWIRESSLGLAIILAFLVVPAIEGNIIAHARRSFRQFADSRAPFTDTAADRALRVAAPAQTTADWITRFLLGLSLGAALFTLLTTGNVKAAVSIIVIGSACSLSSGSFLPVLGAMSRAARLGVLIAAVQIEELAKADVVVLDSSADPAFDSVGNDQSRSREKSDVDVKRAMRLLNKLQIRTVLFTGAAESIGQEIVDRLGVNVLEAELFPQDKVCKIAALRQRARSVVMLSGEVNDPAALFEASVGVVVGSATGVAEKPGDVIASARSLLDLVEVLAIARRARQITMANSILGILIASIGIGIALGGQLYPTWGVALRFFSELTLLAIACSIFLPLFHVRLASARSPHAPADLPPATS